MAALNAKRKANLLAAVAGRAALAGLAGVALTSACAHHEPSRVAPRAPASHAAPLDAADAGDLRWGAPDERGMDARPLIAMASWIASSDVPIYSLLVSKDGVVVFELYTSSVGREEAHYLMSVTKSVTSTLLGIAIDRHLVPPVETSVADALPPTAFASAAERERFRAVTIRDALGMSALDAQVPPHRNLPRDAERERAFLASPNRVKFALTQAILPEPGTSFQYTDITPLVAIGILSYATKETALEFAEETLFRPLGFRNYEWMHEDAAGMDNGAYGLRLRPIDMQKLGVLFLHGGVWGSKQLVSRSWVEQSFTPWIRSGPRAREPNYGDYWWSTPFGPKWRAHVANGWKGQRIAVFPEHGVVVTMTGVLDDHDEDAIFQRVIREHVIPSVDGSNGEPPRPDPAIREALAVAIERARGGPLRGGPTVERRMVPSVDHKTGHHALRPDD
jgi:CubicO group peptidase (beta-lactamase class C family)